MGLQASKSLPEEELDYLQRNTSFTTQELQDWYEKFHADFPNGYIEKESFIDMYQQMFPKGDASQFGEHIFRAYDTDGNGQIDFTEFMTTLSVSCKGTVEEKLTWSFRMYDLDGDGVISLKELTDLIGSIHRMKGDKDRKYASDLAEKIFANVDKNGDDRITKEEFITGAKSSKIIVDILQGKY